MVKHAGSSALNVRRLAKIFANTGDGIAGGIHEASFRLDPGTFFTLLGPSGCGKTTTLRCVAGLEQPSDGTIELGSDVLFHASQGINVPLNRRNIGMVFQSYAIWPHMTVFENVAFPLQVATDRKFDKSEVVRLVGEALERVGLAGFQTRSATRLSGGQQQRVALARAIVKQPKLLLLDEPLSNLDAALRDEMRTELKRLQQEVGITTIYVTHDQAEALEMSGLLAVMNLGRIVQMGPPREIYFRPCDSFVAGFVGATNLLPGVVEEHTAADNVAPVRIADGQVLGCMVAEPKSAAAKIAISVRPEAISILPPSAPASQNGNRLSGTVIFTGFLGNMNRFRVQVGENVLQVSTGSEVQFAKGADVALEFPFEKAIGVPLAHAN